jgi:acyl-CoA synthetase (AMP-forming)/AMP-acid ligase II
VDTYLRDLKEKPWFEEYRLCQMPLSLAPYPDQPVFRFLEIAARDNPDSGIVSAGVEMKYPLVLDRALRLAAALAALGAHKGDRVATILPTSLQFVIADYAISRAGAVHIPSSFLEPESVLLHKFQEGTPTILICMADDPEIGLDAAKSLAAKAGIEHLVVSKRGDFSADRPDHESIASVLWLTDLIDQYPPSPPAIAIAPDRDLETLLFTGGTTGLPKGCMLTHKNVVANSMQSTAAFGPLADVLGGRFSILIGIPFYHSYGHSIMHTVTHIGATQLLMMDPRDTGALVRAIKEYFPIIQFGVPTQYMKMLKEELKGVNILGVSGSAAMPPEVQERFEQKVKGGVLEGYGLSECSPNTHLNPSLTIRLTGGRNRKGVSKIVHNSLPKIKKYIARGSRRLDSKTVGKIFSRTLPLFMRAADRPEVKKEDKKGSIGIPFVDTEIKVVDEAGRELTCQELLAGKTGEMLIDGPQRMLGYWPEPGSGIDREGYVATGDVVRMDGHGYFYVVDRIKDMINVSGYKVYSREIDDLLYTHPAVEIAAAIGIDDPERPGSEKVKIFVQLKPEFRGRTRPDEIKDFLRDKVARYAQPAAVEFVDQIPVTGVGKVDKKLLRSAKAQV